ncbi:MAG: hypothetical protein ABIR62_08040 [Dokdonella sp.]|uniref:hypothetical protein n=1 Tax=Dokdonella sp. TaxID=2291710 RepID=UPI003265262F
MEGSEQLPDVFVRRGEVVALRLFDIAYSIDLGAAEALCAAHSNARSNRGRLSQTPEKAIAFGDPPVILPLEPVRLDIEGRETTVAATVRLYDFGAIAISLRFAVESRSWAGFEGLVGAIQTSVGPASSSDIWRRLLDQAMPVIESALTRPSPATLQEDYLIATVLELGEPISAVELQRRVDLSALLSGETRALSTGEKRELLKQSYSYFDNDLVVLTWDRAFIYEPEGNTDVADVLEVANAQLLELRYYDELLDAELPRMYDQVEIARRGISSLAASRFAQLARSLYTLVAEVTEVTEKVDNALQVTEDVYLARIYSSALELFRVSKLSAAVYRKLAIVRDTYIALYEEASSSRGELLEFAIIVLILIEILLGIARL